MITIFSIPKPFINENKNIQINSIKNWSEIKKSRIILFGNKDEDLNIPIEYKNLLIKSLGSNSYQTPLISDAFKNIKKESKDDIIIYTNCDIIFSEEINLIINFISSNFQKLGNFLCYGRRRDLSCELDYQNIKNKNFLINNSKLHSYSGIDYLIYKKDAEFELPNFAVGRPGWDNWLVYNLFKKGFKLIDVTKVLNVYHQKHRSAYTRYSQESLNNLKLITNYSEIFTIRNSTHRIVKKSTSYRLVKNKFSYFYNSFLMRKILLHKRVIFNRLNFFIK